MVFPSLARGGSSPHTRGTRRASRPTSSPAAVHPRIRGERDVAGPRTADVHGSSPHTRGTLELKQNGKMIPRFIPAYAGNADPGPSGMTGHPVHPRMRGERQLVVARPFADFGSSPHARGTRRRTAWPAGCNPVHPRMRGERLRSSASRMRVGGSSPHARGTLGHAIEDDQDRRFIPACAGNAR